MKLVRTLTVIALAGCASTPVGDPPAAGRDRERAAASDDERRVWIGAAGDLPAAGHGTLRQEEFTVSLRSGELLIKLTPLDEAVIRLAAPDTYRRLHALTESRRGDLRRGAGGSDVMPFLVSFFSYARDVTFRPDDIEIESQGRLLRPLTVVPITPAWGRQRLRQQETHSAIYGFDARIDLSMPMAVRYGFERTDAWNRIIPRLETEYTRVLSQTGR